MPGERKQMLARVDPETHLITTAAARIDKVAMAQIVDEAIALWLKSQPRAKKTKIKELMELLR